MHYISDVLAGWALGASWLAVTAVAFRRWCGDDRSGTEMLRAGLVPEAGRDLRGISAERPVPDRLWVVGAQLGVAWLLVLGMVFGMGLLITGGRSGILDADRAVVRWIAERRQPALGPVSTVGSWLGNTHWVMAGNLAASVVVLAVRRQWRPVVFLLVVMAGEVTLFLTASTIITRARPGVPHLGPEVPATSSFPSGHVAAATCLYGALARLMWHWATGWLRGMALAVALFVPGYVAASRLYWGVHHPLDIAGSLLLSAGWLAASWWALRPVP